MTMEAEHSLLELIDDIYAAAVDPEHWGPTLNRLATAMNANSSAFYHKSALLPAPKFFGTVNLDPDLMAEYGAYYHRIDPWESFNEETPEGSVHLTQEVMSDREMEKTEFYYDFLRRVKVFSAFGSNIVKSESDIMYLGFQRPQNNEKFGEREAAILRKLSPHIQRAVQIGIRLGERDLRRAATAEALNTAPYGVLLLGEMGQVVFANRTIETLVNDGDGMVLAPTGLRCERQSDDRRLQQVIGGAIAKGLGAGGVIAVPRRSGKKPYTVTVAPLAKRDVLFALIRPAAIVFIADPEYHAVTPADALQRLYHLTGREAELAMWLATGISLDAAADHLLMAKETARRHLKRLFRKTDTRRQAELVRLLATLPPVVGSAEQATK